MEKMMIHCRPTVNAMSMHLLSREEGFKSSVFRRASSQFILPLALPALPSSSSSLSVRPKGS
jgi:hypothetical protein